MVVPRLGPALLLLAGSALAQVPRLGPEAPLRLDVGLEMPRRLEIDASSGASLLIEARSDALDLRLRRLDRAAPLRDLPELDLVAEWMLLEPPFAAPALPLELSVGPHFDTQGHAALRAWPVSGPRLDWLRRVDALLSAVRGDHHAALAPLAAPIDALLADAPVGDPVATDLAVVAAFAERAGGDGARARERLQAVLPDLADREASLRARRTLAFWRLDDGDRAGGEALLAELVREREGERHSSPGRLAAAVNDLALAAHIGGDLARARDGYQRAMKLAREAGDRVREGVLANNLGGVHSMSGEPEPAVARFREAMAVHEAAGNPGGVADAAGNLAELLGTLGEYSEAFALQQQVLAHYRRVGDGRGETRVHRRLAELYRVQGDAEQARALLERVADDARRRQDRVLQVVVSRELATLDLGQGDAAAALAALEQGLGLLAADADPRLHAQLRLLEAEAALETGQAGRAAAALGKLDALPEQSLDPLLRSRAELLTARSASDAGGVEALAAIERALDVARTLDNPGRALDALLLRAQWFADRGRNSEAAKDFAAAGKLLERIRDAALTGALRAELLASQRRLWETEVAWHMAAAGEDPAAPRAALEAAERYRARALFDELAGPPGDEPAELRKARRTLVARLRELSQPPQAGGEARASAARQAAARARLRYDAELAASGRSPPQAPPALELDALRAELGAEAVALVYSVGEAASHAWRVTVDGIDGRSLPGRAELAAAVARLDAELRDGSGPGGPEARALGDLLVGDWLPPEDTLLLLVPDDALHRVAFAALAPDGRALVERHPQVQLPALAFAAPVLAADSGPLLLFADPSYPGEGSAPSRGPGWPELAALPGSRREAEAIAALLPADQVERHLGAAASATALLRHAPRAGVLHVAAHGLADPRHPPLSGLYLGAGERDDGFVGALDIAALDLRARLVVLSACETARGRVLAGEGMNGLARAFLGAGAQRVLASQWQVPDYATSQLMEAFYRSYFGDAGDAARALRQAQLTLLAHPRLRAPRNWAAFQLMGEWRRWRQQP